MNLNPIGEREFLAEILLSRRMAWEKRLSELEAKREEEVAKAKKSSDWQEINDEVWPKLQIIIRQKANEGFDKTGNIEVENIYSNMIKLYVENKGFKIAITTIDGSSFINISWEHAEYVRYSH